MFYQTEHFGAADYFKKEEGENFSFAPHLHQSFELILLKEGTMYITADGCEQKMTKGQGALILPNQVHSLSSTESKHILFIFSPKIIQAFFTETKGKLPKKNVFTLPPRLFDLLLDLKREEKEYNMKGLLYSACAAFDAEAEYYEAEPDKQGLLFRMLSYVEHHFRDECTLNALSGSAGYNAEYLSRFFKKKTGIPYNTYLNTRRINHAVYLLNNSDDSCLNCALECGYTSLRSFNRNFKAITGYTPKEYRNHRKQKA